MVNNGGTQSPYTSPPSPSQVGLPGGFNFGTLSRIWKFANFQGSALRARETTEPPLRGVKKIFFFIFF